MLLLLLLLRRRWRMVVLLLLLLLMGEVVLLDDVLWFRLLGLHWGFVLLLLLLLLGGWDVTWVGHGLHVEVSLLMLLLCDWWLLIVVLVGVVLLHWGCLCRLRLDLHRLQERGLLLLQLHFLQLLQVQLHLANRHYVVGWGGLVVIF